MPIDAEAIKRLKEETGAGVMDAKNALEEAGNDYETAKQALIAKGLAKAETKSERVTRDGLVYSYIHSGGKVGSMVLLACETDFVAKTEDFRKLCHEIALQVATEEYEDVNQLIESEYIRDGSKKVSDLIKETIAKVGENIELKEFARFSVRG
jgi:elongation factor Ts